MINIDDKFSFQILDWDEYQHEEEEDCAKREVYEETGLKIDSLKDKKKFQRN